ncbi:MAG: LITAF-like zinc ribbon domain-containing protein, partial [Desulfobacterales bacterium]|nr:LITAF-like zinc ribbon domain-containing protein [Desulfobacterales bacterium]
MLYRPVSMTCPHCTAEMKTNISQEAGSLAWLIGGV